jgi:hypothetical protein
VNSVNSQGRRASPTDQRQADEAGAEGEDRRVDRRIV